MSEEQKTEQEHEKEAGQDPAKALSPMQQRWIFYLYAGISWAESANIEDEEERKFLLARCWEMKQSRDAEMEAEAAKEKEMEARMLGMHEGLQGKIDALPQQTSPDE